MVFTRQYTYAIYPLLSTCVSCLSILDQSRIKNLSDGLQDGIFLQKLFTGTGRQLFS